MPTGLDVGRSSVKDDWLLWYEALEQLQSSEMSVHRSHCETNPLTGVEVITFVKSHWTIASLGKVGCQPVLLQQISSDSFYYLVCSQN